MKDSIKRILALTRKECYQAFHSPALYGTAVFFILFVSIWFFYLNRFFIRDTASLRMFFAGFPLAFILVIPVITMKSWAEERKLNSLEILLTMPFSEWELCLGKFLSSLLSLLPMILLTVPVPISLFPLGDFDAGVIAGEYIGALLLGASAISLGLFLSALSKNQAASFLGSAVVLMIIMLINQFTAWASLPAWLSQALNYISLSFHFESFARGLLDSRDLAFFILTTALFLFLNTRVLIRRRWS
ncbi:MAG: ABC transporter permease [Treponema sp.]|jgi:ABC-2 type transport system permease protein|nr:ABC transporter permease [Treponema sp.]